MSEHSEYDVIVVGGGGSGLAAACSAAENGGRVLVLEKESQPGGTTGIAVGSFTAAETRIQQAAGIQDLVDDHVVDAGKFAPPEIEALNNRGLREYFLVQAAETLQWLCELGISFVGPNPEPPNRVARMHNVVPGAKAYIATLQIELQRKGVDLRCDAKVCELVRNEAGRVVDVLCAIGGQQMRFAAKRGVILAGGDYANNPELIARYKGDQFREIEGINPFATGEGHRLAEQAGAKLVNMQVTYGPELRFVPSGKKPFQQWLPASGPLSRLMGVMARRMPDWLMRRMIKRLLVTWQHPENSLFDDGAILVNQDGRRFVNETAWPAREIGVSRQPGKLAYILLDGRLAEKYSMWPHFISTAPDIAYAYVRDYQKLRPDVTASADSLARLAAMRGLDAEALAASVSSLNGYVAEQHPDPFGREVAAHSLSNPPWYLLGPVKAYFTTTEGGAAINPRLQVLNEAGKVIPGLYAVGQNGLGGMILWGHGLHIAWAMTSGRLAGLEIMKEST